MTHYVPSYSGDPFPLVVKKSRAEATTRRSAGARVWLARVLFGVLFAGVLALLAYEIQVARHSGWTPSSLIAK